MAWSLRPILWLANGPALAAPNSAAPLPSCGRNEFPVPCVLHVASTSSGCFCLSVWSGRDEELDNREDAVRGWHGSPLPAPGTAQPWSGGGWAHGSERSERRFWCGPAAARCPHCWGGHHGGRRRRWPGPREQGRPRLLARGVSVRHGNPLG